MFERVFGLAAHGTSVRTEVMAGCTTFLTMAYITFVNPLILSEAGMDFGGVFVATCLAAAIGTSIMALAANYPVQYVYEVCQLGSYRLGAPLGWNVLGIRSAERIDAEQNYVDAVIPSLVELLPDHAAYLELRSKDIEQQFEEALSDANLKRAARAAIETVVPTWSDELAACALSLTDAQVAGLSESEREVRRRLLPVPKVDEQD